MLPKLKLPLALPENSDYNFVIVIMVRKGVQTMGKGAEFLKEAGTYFIATSDGNGQPQLRPFGSKLEYQGRFYINTGKSKNVFKQIIANPKISIAAMKPNRDWIRVIAEAVLDESEEVRDYLFEQSPRMRENYGDNLQECAIFYLQQAICIINEAGKEPEQVEL